MLVAHHAELIYSQAVRDEKIREDAGEDIETQDVFFAKFGIDEARELIRNAHTTPVGGVSKLIVVRTDFITLEAQNALLKVLEEPPQSTRFMFVVSAGFNLLPTLHSRFSVRSDSQYANNKNEPFENFLNDSYQNRLAMIDKAVKSKNTDWQQSIKQGLMDYVTQADKNSDSLSGLEYVARTLLTRGASNKMLLEHVALLLSTR